MPANKKLNIYVVEDMALARLSLIQILTNQGHSVLGSSANVNSAIPQLSNLPIDLVLLDVNLRGKRDGIWLGEYIRENLNLPFIYLTAYGDDKTLERIHSTEPDGYIMKPYNETTLLNTIAIAYSRFNKDNENVEEVSQIVDWFVLRNKDSSKIKVNFEDVKYAQSDGNYVKIVTIENNYLERVRLKNIRDVLPTKNFIKINKSVIANVAYVTKVDADHLSMGEVIFPISRVYKKEFLDAYQGKK